MAKRTTTIESDAPEKAPAKKQPVKRAAKKKVNAKKAVEETVVVAKAGAVSKGKAKAKAKTRAKSKGKAKKTLVTAEVDATETKAPRRRSGEHYLVVVESPAKAKTIKKYLGSGHTVKASVGHVKALPK